MPGRQRPIAGRARRPRRGGLVGCTRLTEETRATVKSVTCNDVPCQGWRASTVGPGISFEPTSSGPLRIHVDLQRRRVLDLAAVDLCEEPDRASGAWMRDDRGSPPCAMPAEHAAPTARSRRPCRSPASKASRPRPPTSATSRTAAARPRCCSTRRPTEVTRESSARSGPPAPPLRRSGSGRGSRRADERPRGEVRQRRAVRLARGRRGDADRRHARGRRRGGTAVRAR